MLNINQNGAELFITSLTGDPIRPNVDTQQTLELQLIANKNFPTIVPA
jgi:hypothetical protein